MVSEYKNEKRDCRSNIEVWGCLHGSGNSCTGGSQGLSPTKPQRTSRK